MSRGYWNIITECMSNFIRGSILYFLLRTNLTVVTDPSELPPKYE